MPITRPAFGVASVTPILAAVGRDPLTIEILSFEYNQRRNRSFSAISLMTAGSGWYPCRERRVLYR